MSYYFTSESVSSGHPDKVCDQISDAILDAYLEQDKKARVAVETMVTTNNVIISGEVSSTADINIDFIVRKTIKEIGYDRPDYNFDCQTVRITNLIHSQSPDIAMGVNRDEEDEQGAGDQGIMFGYAVNECVGCIPATLYLSHLFMSELERIRKEGEVMTYLRPDAKCQVSIIYDDNDVPQCIDTVLISTQHDVFAETDEQMQATIKSDIRKYLIPRVIEWVADTFGCYTHLYKLLKRNFILIVNPTGRFVIGGPDGDTGLTGRKIIVDTYGGKGAHGGGAFSGKCPSKVDRSAAYFARYLAKNIVYSGVADECLIQISYAIGQANPISVFVNTFGRSNTKMSDDNIALLLSKEFDLRPKAIEKYFDLCRPIYKQTAKYGHFGLCGSYKDADNNPWEVVDIDLKMKELFLK